METVQLQDPQGRPRPLHTRGTPADKGVVQQIFQNQDYWLGRLRRGAELHRWYDTAVEKGQRPFILDAGANIGASAVWFNFEFPAATIVAIEPEAANFDLLLKNTAGLNVDARKAALGSCAGMASIFDPGEGEWGYRTATAREGTIPQLSADDLVSEFSGKGFLPFIAKIDIEGGEAELFSQNVGWVDAFPLLIIELHDWLLPGAGSSLPFLKCIAQRDRDFVYIGENVFSIRN